MDFTKLMKIELHAHLNGSLSNEAFVELLKLKDPENNSDTLESYKIVEGEVFNLACCFEKFKWAHSLTETKESLALATDWVIRDFDKDNVIYLELRTTPRKTDHLTKHEYLETVVQTIQACSSKYKTDVRLLPSIDRSQGRIAAEENLEIILSLKRVYADLIVGIDFSGDPTKNTFAMYKDLFEKARNNGLKIALHCGEVANADEEIMEMLNFGVDRIGHGTFINGAGFQLVIEQRIPIECCLSSNVKCGTVNEYKDHHFQKFFVVNHPVVICTDDFGVFDTTLSKELEICYNTFNLDLSALDVLSVNAVNASFLSEAEKKILLRKVRVHQCE